MDASDIEQVGQDVYEKYKPLFDSTGLCLLSGMRYDPLLSETVPRSVAELTRANFFLFDEHYHRLKFTADYFCRHSSDDFDLNLSADEFYSKIISTFTASGCPLDVPMKLRVLLASDGKLTIELHQTPARQNLLDGLLDPLSTPYWDVYKDAKFVPPSPLTSFKTTSRAHYNEARSRCLPGLRPGCEEVLLQNPQGNATEGSITNFAVQRNGKWITPPLSTGCLCGVTRHFLLRKGYVEENIVSMQSIKEGDEVLLFNGVIGVVRGTVMGRGV